MKKIFLVAVLMGMSICVFAEPVPVPAVQSSVTSVEKSITGKITDLKTAETLAGACITYNGQKIYSDLEGNFLIKNFVPTSKEIKISLISYEDKMIEIDSEESSTLKIKLKQR